MTDDESELRWYFSDAASECGIRSIQGGFEAAMRRGYVDSGGPGTFDGPTDRAVAAWGRYRRVWQRVDRCGIHERRVLELAYSAPESVRSVSLGLVAAQTSAVNGHGAAKGAAGHTVAQWIVWLASRREDAAVRLLTEIVADARQELARAMAAYRGADRRAA